MSSIAISYGENGSVFCGLKSDGSHLVTCYGSNSAIIYGTPAHFPFIGLTAGDGFVCGLLMGSNQPYCWGSSGYIPMGVPQPMVKEAEYIEISAGDYHLCGLRKPLTGRHRNYSLVDCWGYNMTKNNVFDGQIQSISAGSEFNCGLLSQNRSVFVGVMRLVAIKFHACGIKSYDHGVICWGSIVKPSTPAPNGIKVYEIAAGNYFTCGILAEKSLLPVCWGLGFPSSLPLAVSPGLCKTTPCTPGSYEFNDDNAPCKSPNSHVCLPCRNGCPAEMYQKTECTLKSNRQCDYNCSSCYSTECFSNCSASYSDAAIGKKDERFWSLQLPVIIVEIGFAVFLVIVVSATATLYVRFRLRNCQCSEKEATSQKNKERGASFPKDNGKIRQDSDERKIRRAHMFSYEELERATNGFKEESLVGKGSFSCVYKGY
ncbi:hypothetical protein GH714_010814 [Hevea brasiliensis]|uniref:non-specific serine/threonine protein kinase n=1 Tax=Hevea brasiliensis TaxID=3981 RepID=A0A6A6LI76_HEVBR|nr:hypothetical protein GH714_010814 [Hevea brasiliensis]